VGRGRTTWSRARTWGTVTAGLSPPQAQARLDEEVMRQETQGDVMMPADPAPHLVVVEADLAFALLNAPLHRPARRAALGQRLLGEVGRGVGKDNPTVICFPPFTCLRRFSRTYPGGPSPCPRHYSAAFGYDAASALPPVRWHARVPSRGEAV